MKYFVFHVSETLHQTRNLSDHNNKNCSIFKATFGESFWMPSLALLFQVSHIIKADGITGDDFYELFLVICYSLAVLSIFPRDLGGKCFQYSAPKSPSNFNILLSNMKCWIQSADHVWLENFITSNKVRTDIIKQDYELFGDLFDIWR